MQELSTGLHPVLFLPVTGVLGTHASDPCPEVPSIMLQNNIKTRSLNSNLRKRHEGVQCVFLVTVSKGTHLNSKSLLLHIPVVGMQMDAIILEANLAKI